MGVGPALYFDSGLPAPEHGGSGPTLLSTWLQDEARIQKVTRRMHTLEEVNNNAKLLHEMLLHCSREAASEADKELMKVGVPWASTIRHPAPGSCPASASITLSHWEVSKLLAWVGTGSPCGHLSTPKTSPPQPGSKGRAVLRPVSGSLQELFDRCENKRRTLFKLASETEDNDNSLGEQPRGCLGAPWLGGSLWVCGPSVIMPPEVSAVF